RSKPACGTAPSSATAPIISPAAECAQTAVLFASLGFKYGPAMLAFYEPFLAAFGPAGFPVAHLLLFVITVVVLAVWAQAQRGAAFWTALAIAPFVLTRHVATNVLDQGHLDLLPVLLCLVGVIAVERGYYAVAAATIGVSITAKLLPGLVFVP